MPSAPPRVAALLEEGRIPVLAPLARGPLNVNGDEAAAALAVGLRASRILFLTDVPGLLRDGAVVERIGVAEAEELLASGELAGGIVPKLAAAVLAARNGVASEIGRTMVSAI
jgi:acetylglutamate kinase